MRSIFNAIKKYNRINKDFCTKLANLAAKFDFKAKEEAMKSINIFAENKKGNSEAGKKAGSQRLAGILHQMYLERMNRTLMDLKNRIGK